MINTIYVNEKDHTVLVNIPGDTLWKNIMLDWENTIQHFPEIYVIYAKHEGREVIINLPKNITNYITSK